MESTATITAWEPPRRFALESKDDMGPGSPPIASEWTVESRTGSTCIVRVVHSWFADGDDWDNQVEGLEQGWPSFFRILRIALTHYRGLPSGALQAMAMSASPVPQVWSTVITELGFVHAAETQYLKSQASGLPLAGRVERVGRPEDPELLLKLDEPAPGTAHLFAMSMGGQTCLSLRAYFYGDQAAAVAAREEPRWQAWIQERFPAAGDADMAESPGVTAQ